MRGAGKFLVGGLIGAVIGLVAAPKRRKVRRTPQDRVSRTVPSSAVGTVEAEIPAGATAAWPPESGSLGPSEVEAAFEVELQIEPERKAEVAQPEPEPVEPEAVEPEPEAVEPGPVHVAAESSEAVDDFAWPEPEEAPYVEYEPPAPSGPDHVDPAPVFFARSAALPVESAPAPSEAGAEEPASDVESESNETPPAGTEVALDWRLPEPVEELEGALGPEAGAQETEEPPVAGKGWTSLEDEALETVTEPEYEIVEVEPETIVEVDAPTAAGIADLKARIEETRRRIRQELDQPFADKSELVAGEEAVVPAAEAVEVPEEPAAETFADAEVADAEVADSGEEPAFFDESVETFEESSEIFASTEAAVSELESTAPPEALETTETLDVPEMPAVSEAIEAPLKAEPEIAEPGPQEPSSAEPEAESEAVPEAPETEEAAVESVDMLSGDGFDHEAMRRRIEETRSRLKAKAFDAMMKGESSLLGRDEEGESDSGLAPDAEAHVDNEVAETIDSALSEEDF